MTANRLQTASSAYLQSAAHQPIDWHEFGEEAFQLAKELDRPILLDIGAVWCHWCHVIDRESYENAEIAALINQHYVPIKADRDQRPDVDARYQQVVQSMTGQGGWPLTAFLTYDGRAIYAGTYFPPEAMKNILQRVHEIYHEKKKEIFNAKDTLTEDKIRAIEMAQREAKGQAAPLETVQPKRLKTLCGDFLDVVLSSMKRTYEPVYGGFGQQPKFPHYSTLEWIMAYLDHAGSQRQDLLEKLEKTLTEMACGGMADQLMGGFHRYSVDERWHVPHFEKLAYDNAEALKVYAQAYRLTGTPLFKEVALGIIGWVNELLSNQAQGGFYASQDADINLHDDGDHFTWSLEELREILTPQEQTVVSRYYDINASGDMPHAQGRNVLCVSRPLLTVAQELGMGAGDAEQLLASTQDKMREQRRKRPQPFVDKTLYVNWNGMMIAAYFEAADLLDLPEVRRFAELSLERMLREFYRKGQSVQHATGVDGFLEDYAWLALAALKGYQSTENADYLEVAQDLVEMVQQRFEDQRLGGFYDVSQAEPVMSMLQVKRKPVEDNSSSSANAIVLQVLGSLYAITNREAYRDSWEKGLNLLINTNGHYGLYVSALAVAAIFYANPPLKLEVTGNDYDLKQAARYLYSPGKVVTYQPEAVVSEIRPCSGNRCLSPIKDAANLSALLSEMTPIG